MPNLTVSANVDSMLSAADNAAIRSAIGVGTTDVPAFAGLSTTGNAGIGTATPASGLHVSGALGTNVITYDSAAALKLTNTTGGSWLVTSGVIGVANAHFSIRQEGVAQPAIVVTSTGNNIGIGTNAPTAKLDILDTTLSGSGSLAGSALNIAQTWNTSGTPSAIKLNVTATAANAASRLLDLQIGGTSRMRVGIEGGVFSQNSADTGGLFSAGSNGFKTIQFGGSLFTSNGLAAIRDPGLVVLRDGGGFCWVDASQNPATGTIELSLLKDAAGILAQRNGVNAQAFRVYNTTDAGITNYERVNLEWSSSQAILQTVKGGTGANRDLVLRSNNNLLFGVAGGSQWYIAGGSGNFLAVTDNAYDIGASGANRPRNIYTAGAINIGSGFGLVFGNNTVLFPAASGVLRVGNTSDTGGFRLNGGTLDYCKVQKFDGTGFGAIQGKLTTDTAYTGTVVAATGYITIYDSLGQAYRVPCAV